MTSNIDSITSDISRVEMLADEEGLTGTLVMTPEANTIVAFPLGTLLAADGYSRFKHQVSNLIDAALHR